MNAISKLEIELDHPTADIPTRTSIVYTDLENNSIRLLKILPGDTTSEVCCEIAQFSLYDVPQYSALSYVWGSKPAVGVVRLNGKRLAIRKNLWRFLRQAQKLGNKMSGWLWIDALCIDQGNLEERTHQVSLMSKIYATAQRVIVWLGPSYEYSDQAMLALSKPLSAWQSERVLSKIWSTQVGLAISRMCERSYWRRLWVFQELMLAQKIELQCGGSGIPWNLFRDFLLEANNGIPMPSVRDNSSHAIVRSSVAMAMVTQVTQGLDRRTLFDLFLATRHLKCSDPRDRFYGLLGIVGVVSGDIQADYNMPLVFLLNKVLRTEHDTKAPDTIEEVVWECERLTSLTGLDRGAIFSFEQWQGWTPIPQTRATAEHTLAIERSRVSLWWCAFYGHTAVAELLFKEKEIVRAWDRSLQLAVECGDEVTVRILLKADPIDKDLRKRQLCPITNAFYLAVDGERAAIARVLYESRRVDLPYRGRSRSRSMPLA